MTLVSMYLYSYLVIVMVILLVVPMLVCGGDDSKVHIFTADDNEVWRERERERKRERNRIFLCLHLVLQQSTCFGWS